MILDNLQTGGIFKFLHKFFEIKVNFTTEMTPVIRTRLYKASPQELVWALTQNWNAWKKLYTGLEKKQNPGLFMQTGARGHPTYERWVDRDGRGKTSEYASSVILIFGSYKRFMYLEKNCIPNEKCKPKN